MSEKTAGESDSMSYNTMTQEKESGQGKEWAKRRAWLDLPSRKGSENKKVSKVNGRQLAGGVNVGRGMIKRGRTRW